MPNPFHDSRVDNSKYSVDSPKSQTLQVKPDRKQFEVDGVSLAQRIGKKVSALFTFVSLLSSDETLFDAIGQGISFPFHDGNGLKYLIKRRKKVYVFLPTYL